jgi:hypothetical protein
LLEAIMSECPFAGKRAKPAGGGNNLELNIR